MEIYSIMSGEDLYQKLSIRDYSGSEADEYAQLLQTMYFYCTAQDSQEAFFALLEKAEQLELQLTLKDEEVEEITLDQIVLS